MISLGLGFFVESDFKEARLIIEKRKKHLNDKLEKKEKKHSEIESQIRTVNKHTFTLFKHINKQKINSSLLTNFNKYFFILVRKGLKRH